MKCKLGDLTLRQILKACDATRTCTVCSMRRSQMCEIVNDIHQTMEFVSLDAEIDLPDEVDSDGEGEFQHKKDTRAVQSLGEYALCDQWVCPRCGIEIQDYVEIERDEDDGEEIQHEYCPKFCPECGTRIIDPDEEVIK